MTVEVPKERNPDQFDYLFKFIIIGDAGTGKSCILHQFIESKFKRSSAHTIGVEFGSKIIQVGGRSIKLQIWDTAGQERYRSVTRSYYRGAAGALIVYDVTNRDSYNHLVNWLADARTLARADISIVAVGNKCDLREERAVTFLEASRVAQENDVLFLETSALSGEGVEEAFVKVAKTILNKIEDGLIDPSAMFSGHRRGKEGASKEFIFRGACEGSRDEDMHRQLKRQPSANTERIGTSLDASEGRAGESDKAEGSGKDPSYQEGVSQSSTSADMGGLESAFFAMEQRRLRRVLGGREKARGKGDVAIKVLVIFVIFQFVVTQLAISKDTSIERALRSDLTVALLVVMTVVGCMYVVYDCYSSPEHVHGKLSVGVLYCCALWYTWVYATREDQNRSIFALSRDEILIVGVFVLAEFLIFLAYITSHWFYPVCLQKIARSRRVALWWFGWTPSKEDTSTVSYRPMGWLWPSRSTFHYGGAVDIKGRPHGWGMWCDDSYHGECLVGRWRRGLPVGPFRSREKGTGANFACNYIGYCTSRDEALNQKFIFPKRAPEGLRYGLVGVEASCGGGFFEHLPRLNEHQPFDGRRADLGGSELEELLDPDNDVRGLQCCLSALYKAKMDCMGNADIEMGVEGEEEGGELMTPNLALDMDFRIVEDEELEKLHASSPLEEVPLISGSLDYTVVNGRIYVQRSAVSSIPRSILYESKEAFVFIHGYNCTTEFALCKVGQLFALGSFPPKLLPFVFSWSTASALTYHAALNALQGFAEDAATFVRALKDQGVDRVHILAHSIGAQIAFRMLDVLVDGGHMNELRPDGRKSHPIPKGGNGLVTISNFIVMNGDYPLAQFKDKQLEQCRRFVGRTTVYADRNDGALFWSEFINRVPTVGKKTDPFFIGGRTDIPWALSSSGVQECCEWVDIIDTTDMDQNVHSLRHSYFNLNMQVGAAGVHQRKEDILGPAECVDRPRFQIIGDMVDLIRSEAPAISRFKNISQRAPGENVFTFMSPPSFINADRTG